MYVTIDRLPVFLSPGIWSDAVNLNYGSHDFYLADEYQGVSGLYPAVRYLYEGKYYTEYMYPNVTDGWLEILSESTQQPIEISSSVSTHRCSYSAWEVITEASGVNPGERVRSCACGLTDRESYQLAVIASGTCGDQLTWTLTEDHVLTVQGTGTMKNYESYSTYRSPWYDYREQIETVVLEDGVGSIGRYAFYNCTELTDVTVGSGVAYISHNAFEGCTALEEFVVPDSVTALGPGVFRDCTALTKLTVGKGLAELGKTPGGSGTASLLYGCTGLTAIEVSEENAVFSSVDGVLFSKDQTALFHYPAGRTDTSYTVPDGVTTLGYSTWGLSGAFESCTALREVTLPGSVTTIGGSSFKECTALRKAPIPESVTSIGDSAFRGCSMLTDVTLPASVTSVGRWVFTNCTRLTAIEAAEENAAYESADGVLFTEDMKTLKCYPCGKTGRYTIPSTVETVESAAFYQVTGLTEVVIPAGCKIREDTFRCCTSLRSIKCLGDFPFSPVFDEYGWTGASVVEDVTATVYYPAGNTTWNEKTMVNMDGTLIYVAMDGSAPVIFPGQGSGTEADPYLVDSPETLLAVCYSPSGYFEQTCNIDMTDVAWTPIPTFTGTYDGNGYEIIGLEVSRTADSSEIMLGGFADDSTGILRGIRLKDAAVELNATCDSSSTKVYVGGIVGRCRVISDCEMSGSVSLELASGTSYVGGIAGQCYYSAVTGCINRADVSVKGPADGYDQSIGGVCGECGAEKSVNLGSVSVEANTANLYSLYYVGGVVGAGSAGYCYNRGDVTLTSGVRGYVGGVCGTVWTYIGDCYNTGAVSAAFAKTNSYQYVGGVAGTSNMIYDCYQAGTVTVTATGTPYVGPVVSEAGEPESCYYLASSWQGSASYGSPLTAEQMRTYTSFVGFDFKKTWCYGTDPDYAFPVLRAFGDIGHVYTDYVYNNDAACESDGTETALCDICGAAAHTRPAEGTAIGHRFVTYRSNNDAACLRDGTKTALCENGCGAEDTVSDTGSAPGHSTVTDAAVPPTCTEAGKTEGSHCSACGEVFTAQQSVPAAGHTEVIDGAVAPTCVETGLTEGVHCSVCGEVLTAQTVLPATGEHGYELMDEVPPTCTETGLSAGAKCPTCALVYVKQEILPAAGHTPVTDAAVPPTCTEAGKTEGSHCSACGEVLTAQEPVPPADHTPETDAAVEPTCQETGLTEGSHCSVCGEVLTAQEPVPPADHTPETDAAVEPTCQETGLTEGSHCSVCGEVLTAQETLPKKTHTVVIDYPKAPTCTENGTEGMGMHCSVCGEVLQAQTVLPSVGHTPVTDAAVPPTCTEAGKTEGSHCSACGEVFTAQETVPELGHDTVTDEAREPTCEDTGLTAGSHCGRCGEVLTAQEEIAANGHTYGEPEVRWADGFGAVTATAVCHCGTVTEACAVPVWNADGDGRLTARVSLTLGEAVFTETFGVSAVRTADGIAVTLPEQMTGIYVFATAYNRQGQMTDVAGTVAAEETVVLEIASEPAQVFFFNGKHSPILPVLTV